MNQFAYRHAGIAYIFDPDPDHLVEAPSAGSNYLSDPGALWTAEGTFKPRIIATASPPPYIFVLSASEPWPRGVSQPTHALTRIDNPPAGIRTGWILQDDGTTWSAPDHRPAIRAEVEALEHLDEGNLLHHLRICTCTATALERTGKALKKAAETMTAGSTPRNEIEEQAASIADDVQTLKEERATIYGKALPVRIVMAHIEGLGTGNSTRHNSAAAVAEAGTMHQAISGDAALSEDHHSALIEHLRSGGQSAEAITPAVAATRIGQAKAGTLPHQAAATPAPTSPPAEPSPESGGGETSG